MTRDEMKKRLKGFAQLGVKFASLEGGQARGRCPWCGGRRHKTDASKHFVVNPKTRTWDCKACGESGNFRRFLARRAADYAKMMTNADAAWLAADRGLKIKTLRRWRVGHNAAAGCYTVPVYDHGAPGAVVVGVHRYFLKGDKSKRMRGTTGGKNGLVLVDPAAAAAARALWVCEGEWDAMALDEALRAAGDGDAVVAVTGASSAREGLALTAQDKGVLLAFDHDDAGRQGDARARGALAGRARAVASVHWPADSPRGHDVRDMYAEHGRDPAAFLVALRGLTCTPPPSTPGTAEKPLECAARPGTGAQSGHDGPQGGPDAPPAPTRQEVIDVCQRWMYLPNTEVVDVMFGAALSNRFDGDPVWLFVVGAPGCGKTAFFIHFGEAAGVVTTTTLTPATLVSGMQRAGAADPSLIPRLNGKVLVVKDFTTILSMRQDAREEIFGILRDAFDGRIEKWFGNGTHRIYNSRFSVLAGVTSKIEEFGGGHVVVGERFLKYRMRPAGGGRIRVGESAVRRVLNNRGRRADMHEELSDVCRRAIDGARPGGLPALDDHEADLLVRLAMWVAAMRGAVPRDRYTKDILYMPDSEVGTRVVSQLTNLASGVALFRGRRRITTREVTLCARVARDSAPNLLEAMVQAMYVRRRDGWCATGELGEWTRLPADTVRKTMTDASIRGIVNARSTKGRQEWQLSRALARIMTGLDLYVAEKQWKR